MIIVGTMKDSSKKGNLQYIADLFLTLIDGLRATTRVVLPCLALKVVLLRTPLRDVLTRTVINVRVIPILKYVVGDRRWPIRHVCDGLGNLLFLPRRHRLDNLLYIRRSHRLDGRQELYVL